MKFSKWHIAPAEEADIRRLGEAGYPQLVSQVLAARGISTAEEAAAFLERESWVIDGNYAGLLQERRMEEADRIVFLDVCRGRCLLQALGRYWRHRGAGI